jgi:hypothetical protein
MANPEHKLDREIHPEKYKNKEEKDLYKNGIF